MCIRDSLYLVGKGIDLHIEMYPTSLVGPVRSVYEAEFDTAYRARYVRLSLIHI